MLVCQKIESVCVPSYKGKGGNFKGPVCCPRTFPGESEGTLAAFNCSAQAVVIHAKEGGTDGQRQAVWIFLNKLIEGIPFVQNGFGQGRFFVEVIESLPFSRYNIFLL